MRIVAPKTSFFFHFWEKKGVDKKILGGGMKPFFVWGGGQQFVFCLVQFSCEEKGQTNVLGAKVKKN